LKVAVYYSPKDIRLVDKPVPQIGDDEILVRMKACGLCGSDLMDWYLKPRAPIVLGHEPAGIIEKKGKKVKELCVGDRVFVHHHVACLTCHYCLRGDYTLCEQFHETNISPGGFAEKFKAPAPNVQADTLKIPKNMSFKTATLIEPVACCVRAIEKCNLHAGDTVAIIGAGTTGLINTALSRLHGATKTIVSDLFNSRLKQACEFGADVTVNPNENDLKETVLAETEGIGADVVIVTAPSLDAYKTAFSICRKGGRLCIFAPTDPQKKLLMSPKELFFKEIKIVASYSTSHLETRIALQLLQANRINHQKLKTRTFPLEETAKAFKTARETKESLKIVITSN
jgi:L-iditol 2-dehydrogenase